MVEPEELWCLRTGRWGLEGLCKAAYHQEQLQESAHWLVEIDGWADGADSTDGEADSW